RGMARTKLCICCALLLVIAIIAVIIFFSIKCPNGTFRNAAVAADTKKCSEIGRDILQRGGSAVDGAIAALLCTGIMNPQSAGIGGGSIFTVMDSSGNVTIINSRETAPRLVDPYLLKSCPKFFNMFADGNGIWIGVPGEIRGYEMAHKRFGKLPWADLFQPTIKLAREGFPIPPVQAKHLHLSLIVLRKAFSDKNGNLLKARNIIKFEKLADTLEMIANNGSDAFYTGKIAEDLVRDVQEAGGVLRLLDLASYKARETDAWVVPMGEYQMYIPPPPSGGALLSLILNIMKGYQMKSSPQSTDQKTQFYHRYVEALKFTNGVKTHIGDPNFKSEKVGINLNNATQSTCSLIYTWYSVPGQILSYLGHCNNLSLRSSASHHNFVRFKPSPIVLSSVFTVDVFNVVKETQREQQSIFSILILASSVEISTTTHSFSSNEFNQ
uniref:Gamma-glutamyltransferase 5a n=1 Tax=Fundulus heteroclitus TaxID=8078 RepID=A0A3Q2UQN8_FUNHE